MRITAKEIIAEWLKANGYDGLYNHECGCLIDDLIPCGEDPSLCEAGIARERDGITIIIPKYEKG